MGEILISILLMALTSATLVFIGWISRFRFRNLFSRFKLSVLHKAESNQSTDSSTQSDQGAASFEPDANIFSCRVQQENAKKDDCNLDVFTVEIFGSIHAPTDMHYATVQILITDITDGLEKAKPVQARLKKWQAQDSSAFCYNAELSKLGSRVTTLSDWTAVARLQLDRLMFPRKGQRNLQFNTSILSAESGQELACAKCTFTYENPAFGYIDLQENIERAKTLAVALAFAVSAADNRLFDCEVEVIKNWARANIDLSQASSKARGKLDKALNKTVAFFRNGNQLDVYKICKELVEIAPLAERYDILKFCLYVAQANGVASIEELALLKNLAGRLEVDTDRFREMTEKILPAAMHEVEDTEIVLGVTSDMNKEQTRKHLNREYRKWNARVTNFDPEIQAQADHMLQLIAEVRSQCLN